MLFLCILTFLWCFCIFCLVVNLLSHFEQLNGLSPVLVLSWIVTFFRSMNFLSHIEQLNGLSPVCIFSCLLKCPTWVNLFPHTEQINGFSLEYISSWIFKLLFSENLFIHCKELKGLLFWSTALCSCLCFLNSFLLQNLILHSVHSNGFSS